MEILTTPHQFLRHTAKPVAIWDKKTAGQVEEMKEILKKTTNPKGVGLAATQVGLDKRLFVLQLDDGFHIYVNPEIIKTDKKMLTDVYKKKKDRWLEGCLSIPKTWGFVDRPFSITLKYQIPKTLDTSSWILDTVVSDFTDIQAAYVQHELDHLNGVLFTDRILEQKGDIFQETTDGLTKIN